MTTPAQSDDYRNLIDLLAVFNEASMRLQQLERDAIEHAIEYADEIRGDFATTQKAQADAETAIEVLIAQHPEWFEKVRSIKTPYGTVSVRKVSKLEIANEELTVALIQKDPALDDATYLRITEGINREALELLDDASLRRLKVKRVDDETITVKPAKVDLGKAVAAAASEEKQAA